MDFNNIKNKMYDKFHLDNNQVILISFMLISDILCVIGSPTITKAMYEQLPVRWFAAQPMIINGIFLLICYLWNNDKFRKKSIKWFVPLFIVDLVFGVIIFMIMAFYFNPWIYAIGAIIEQSLIAVWLSKIINAFRISLFNDKKREYYDNNVSFFGSISSFLGLFIALIQPPSIKVSCILLSLSCCSSIGWIIVYSKNKELFKNT